MLFDPTNEIFKTAVSFVTGTGRHLFITGKAGTGKTTFLKYVRDRSMKRMAVVAPTGVAAINAGGVTIHSFFQLPFGPFLPGNTKHNNAFESGFNTRETLLRNLRLAGARRDVIRGLELLIIDEVSMVRADLLDAMDTVLRHVRRQPQLPFGGVQMVYIGDLYQLPPVVNNTEWEVLRDHYESPFFFHAKAIQQAPPVYIELKKIYRQSDYIFISLLNNIRNNCCVQADLDALHQYYRPGFTPAKEDGYITLTSHNARADHINQQELERTPGKLHKFEAEVTGDFPDKMFPVEKTLLVKEGAQVMFIKNDKGEQRRYYNGKLALITKIEKDKLHVRCIGDDAELEVEVELWRNIRFRLNKETEEIEEEELGTFSHFPLRLAWAITIHKSQGLTFDKAIIDAGASFAPGQVYVALSRLTSLDGLVLLSRINPSSISNDDRIKPFASTEIAEQAALELLAKEQQTYLHHQLLKSFSWGALIDVLDQHLVEYDSRQIPDKQASIDWATGMLNAATGLQQVAEKLVLRLEYLFSLPEEIRYEQIAERTNAATGFFEKEMQQKLLKPLEDHIKAWKPKTKTKKYIRELHDLQLTLQRQLQHMKQAALLAAGLSKKEDAQQLLEKLHEQRKIVLKTANEETKHKQQKGDTARLSLQLFRSGKTVDEIASERSFTAGTIYGHLVRFILTGDVDVLELLTKEKLDLILAVAAPDDTSGIIKSRLGDAVSFDEIRAALNHLKWKQSNNGN